MVITGLCSWTAISTACKYSDSSIPLAFEYYLPLSMTLKVNVHRSVGMRVFQKFRYSLVFCDFGAIDLGTYVWISWQRMENINSNDLSKSTINYSNGRCRWIHLVHKSVSLLCLSHRDYWRKIESSISSEMIKQNTLRAIRKDWDWDFHCCILVQHSGQFLKIISPKMLIVPLGGISRVD